MQIIACCEALGISAGTSGYIKPFLIYLSNGNWKLVMIDCVPSFHPSIQHTYTLAYHTPKRTFTSNKMEIMSSLLRIFLPVSVKGNQKEAGAMFARH